MEEELQLWPFSLSQVSDATKLRPKAEFCFGKKLLTLTAVIWLSSAVKTLTLDSVCRPSLSSKRGWALISTDFLIRWLIHFVVCLANTQWHRRLHNICVGPWCLLVFQETPSLKRLFTFRLWNVFFFASELKKQTQPWFKVPLQLLWLDTCWQAAVINPQSSAAGWKTLSCNLKC